MRIHHRFITTAALAAATGLLVSGCTRATDAPSSSPSTTSPTPTASTAAPTTPAPAPSDATTTPPAALVDVSPTGTPRDLVTGLDVPWSVVIDEASAAPGTGASSLISQRDTGEIVELTAAGSTRVVATIAGVSHGGEGGLLGLAIDDQRRLYVYSTGADGNRVERYPMEGAAGSIRLGTATTLVDGLPKAGNHNGGRLAFGPDGMLYATVGDAGDRESAQDPAVLAGKILRMTPDGAAPADNPFAGSLVYSLGHRKPQGLGWAADGTMFAAEFGQDTWDELNIIEPGANYGWPVVEGVGGDAAYVDPVQQWAPGDASPSGLTVVDGTVFIANLRGQTLRAVPVADPSTSRDYYVGDYGRLRAVLPGADGELWFVTNNTGGRTTPRDGDDRLLAVPLAPADGSASLQE